MIGVLIADDQSMMRTLLTGVCRAEADMAVLGAAKTGEEAVRMARHDKPDVAVVDLKLPGISGLEVTRRLRRQLPETKVIVLTALDEPGFAARALNAGAQGFLTKHAVHQELVRTIRSVHKGDHYVDAGMAQRIALGSLLDADSPVDQLSDRELDVLLLLLRGHQSAEISQTLSMSPKTVEYHRRSIRQKLNAATDVQVGVFAMRYGLDPMGEGSSDAAGC